MKRRKPRPRPNPDRGAEREIRKLLVWMVGLLLVALLALLKLCAEK